MSMKKNHSIKTATFLLLMMFFGSFGLTAFAWENETPEVPCPETPPPPKEEETPPPPPPPVKEIVIDNSSGSGSSSESNATAVNNTTVNQKTEVEVKVKVDDKENKKLKKNIKKLKSEITEIRTVKSAQRLPASGPGSTGVLAVAGFSMIGAFGLMRKKFF
ncbi:MAG: hypothetical protein ACD_9C00319G0002 [uncultured bacterium]|nr:MAG: hypothetical protein ACD_9C00319G0002 [uncultured bacterium]